MTRTGKGKIPVRGAGRGQEVNAAQRSRALEVIAAHHAGFDFAAALRRDPLRFAHGYEDPRDRELVAFLSALMAFGRVEIIGNKLTALLKLLGQSPSATARSLSKDALSRKLRGFRHRTFAGKDIAALLSVVGERQTRDGSILTSLEGHFTAVGDLRTALSRWVSELRGAAFGERLTQAQRHLLPDPAGPSASKRLLLFLRWVTRDDQGDLGLAKLPTDALVVPVDVHVHRIAKNLGLTARNDASWRTAVEITESLRGLSPSDPTRYDMALCHFGINGECPSRRDAVKCRGCALKPACVWWPAGSTG